LGLGLACGRGRRRRFGLGLLGDSGLGRRFGLGRFGRRGLGRRFGLGLFSRRGTGLADHRQRRADGHGFSFAYEQFDDHALGGRWHLGVDLVRRDLD
jgi:hypothetical protein